MATQLFTIKYKLYLQLCSLELTMFREYSLGWKEHCILHLQILDVTYILVKWENVDIKARAGYKITVMWRDAPIGAP